MLWLPAVMLGVAVFVAGYGVQVLTHPAAGAPPWLGWFLIAVALLKAALWLSVATVRIKFSSPATG